jgi:hypothetical protein
VKFFSKVAAVGASLVTAGALALTGVSMASGAAVVAPTPPPASPGCTAGAFDACNENGFILYNNPWNTGEALNGDVLWANSVNDWGVTSEQDKPGVSPTGVKTFVSAQRDYNNVPVSSLKYMNGQYAEAMPTAADPGLDAEAAYDIFLNGPINEVMIWVDNHGQTPAGAHIGAVTSFGVQYQVYHSSGGGVSFVRSANAQSGSTHILALFKYLEAKGIMPASDALTQWQFGWEICHTDGAQNFSVSHLTLNSNNQGNLAG